MATFVIVHGAWGGAWSWKKIRTLLRAAGHEVYTPTLTGLGERAHLANPEIDLETHIQDVLGVLEYEDLRDVVLVGHSYGGMVITGVADRSAERLACLVYLDAFVPNEGQSLLDLVGPEARARFEEQARTQGEGWRIPPNPLAPDTPEADAAWIAPRRLPHPLRTFVQPVRLTSPAAAALPRTYVYCTFKPGGDAFAQFAARARAEQGWRYYELATGHNLQYTATRELVDLLLEHV